MVLVLVVITVACIMIAASVLLSMSSTTTAISRAMSDHAQSRQIAESGIALAMNYIASQPDWRSIEPDGTWVTNQSLLGGQLTLQGDFDSAIPSLAALADPSFEQQTYELPRPLLNPPMSGTIGGWTVQRTALVKTGPTVPRVGTRTSSKATLGSNQAFVSFVASVVGSATFSQQLPSQLHADCEYEIKIDVHTLGLLPLDHHVGFRLYAGSTLIATTKEALTLWESLDLQEVLLEAQKLLSTACTPALLVRTILTADTSEIKLIFQTSQSPPSGSLRLELYAESIGAITTAGFDNIRLIARNNDPLRLTAVGKYHESSHVTQAVVLRGMNGQPYITEWLDP